MDNIFRYLAHLSNLLSQPQPEAILDGPDSLDAETPGFTRSSYYAFKGIEGHHLSEVAFVMDYIQLHFNWYIFRVLTAPRILIGGGVYQAGEDGFRDAICSLITQMVTNVDCTKDTIFIEFDRDRIELSLVTGTFGKEALMFYPGHQRDVWVFHSI